MLQTLSTSKRIFIGLLLSGTFIILGFVLAIRLSNEYLESIILQSTYEDELKNILESQKNDSLWLPESTHTFGFLASQGNVPIVFIEYGEGQYHDVLWQGQHYHLFVKPISHKQESRDMLYLAIQINALERYEEQLNWLLSIAALTLIILLVWMAYWFTSLISKPLLQLSSQVSQLSTGDKNLPHTIQDEDLLPIIKAINHFLEKIQQYIKHEKLFFGIASHELRTPLSTIRSSLETYMNNLDWDTMDERQAARIQRVKRAVIEMQYISESLLYLVKHEQDTTQQEESYEIAPLLKEIMDEHKALVRNQDVELLMVAHDSPQTQVRKELLKTLVGNLVRNALENTFKGKVSIDLYADRLIIGDSGKGISVEIREWLESGNTETVQDIPVGIGLFLVARLCKQLHWSFTILENTGKQSGSRFQLKW